MDAYAIETTLTWLTVPFMLLFAILGLSVAIVNAIRPSKGSRMARLTRIVKAAWCVDAGVLGITVIASVAISNKTTQMMRSSLQHLNNQSISAITIGRGNLDIELKGAEAQRFIELLNSGEDVKAHHTSPIEDMTIQVKGHSEHVYILGKDEKNVAEYWLKDASCPGCTEGPRKVRQFTSVAMRAFLDERGL